MTPIVFPKIALMRGAKMPAYQTAKSAGFDFAASVTVDIDPGEIVLIPTGVRIQCPDGYFLMLAGRSSLAKKKGLQFINGIGVVDGDYAGPSDEISVVVKNITNEIVTVLSGERIAQGLFIPYAQGSFVMGDMPTENRGGFGSTGGYGVYAPGTK